MSNVAPVNKGYQILPETFAAGLSTLASGTAVVIESQYTGITRTFLAKKVKWRMSMEGLTQGEGPIMIGLCNGTMSTAEIQDALQDDLSTPDDVTTMLSAGIKKGIYWQSLFILDGRDAAVDNHDFRLGARGKGIPMIESVGWKVFAMNWDTNTLTTGALIRGMYWVEGVWLND